ncbi:hypothetical protein NBRGN_021_00180 [Nocardia brasiliensis NBRC 14402]|uniref:WXG100-like domain-containing protein n=1 Tax=Nocardia brasiliensis TaxID=37326 RepID=UPI0003021C90|nr:T3SS effector HopA1 family protein [Nocardia brasiliensis]GAJ80027.1 hypothetical protein NBRGN_021_00180 [Nocardia brasiliensis NBRC 14402]
MSIEMPAELQWLSYLAGAAWPEGDEDKMFALNDDYKSAADTLDAALDLLRSACDTATASYSGDGADKMKSQFDQFFAGEQSIPKLIDTMRQVGKSCRAMGAEIEHTKLQVIITLAILAAEIAYALTTWFGAVVIPALQAETAGIMAVIGRTLATRLEFLVNHAAKIAAMPMWKLAAISGGVQGVIGLGTEFAVEAIQKSKGHIDDFDLKRIFVAGAVGAVSGAVAAPVASVIGKGLANWVGKESMTWWKSGGIAIGAGIPGGLVGAGAGFVTGGALTGEWEFDPAMLAGAVGGGILGGLHGSIGHARAGAMVNVKAVTAKSDLSLSDGSSIYSASEKDGGGAGAPRGSGDRTDNGQQTRAMSHTGDTGNGNGRSTTSGSVGAEGNSRAASVHGNGNGSANTNGNGNGNGNGSTRSASVRTGSISAASVLRPRTDSISSSASDGSVSRASSVSGGSSHTSMTSFSDAKGSDAAPRTAHTFDGASESASGPVSRASSPEPQGMHNLRTDGLPQEKISAGPESLSGASVSGNSSRESAQFSAGPDARTGSDQASRISATDTGSSTNLRDVRPVTGASGGESRSGIETPSRSGTPDPEARPRSAAPSTSSSVGGGSQTRISAGPNESGPPGPRTVTGREDQSVSGSSSRAASPERTPAPPAARPESLAAHNESGPDGLARSKSGDDSGAHPETTGPERKNGQDETGDQSIRRPRAHLTENPDNPALPEQPGRRAAEEPTDTRVTELRNRLRDSDEVQDHRDVTATRERLKTAEAEFEDTRRLVEHDQSPKEGASALALREMHDDAATQLEQARTAHDAAIDRAVDERYAQLQAEADQAILTADREADTVHTDTARRLQEAQDSFRDARQRWENSRDEYNAAAANHEARADGELVKSITEAHNRVRDANQGLVQARREYNAEARASEPRAERLSWLRTDIEARTQGLRTELVEREALLRAAAKHNAELSTARAERWALDPNEKSSVATRLLNWLQSGSGEGVRTGKVIGDPRQFEADVRTRARSLQDEFDSKDSAARADSSLSELKQQLADSTASYQAARDHLSEVGLQAIGDRTVVLRNAGLADKAAFDGGLAERGPAFEAIVRKQMAAARDVLDAISAYDHQLLSKGRPDDPVTVPLSGEQLRKVIAEGTPEERLAHLRAFVKMTHPEGFEPRENQMLGYLLRVGNLGTGQGKEMLMAMRLFTDAVEQGTAYGTTSSDNLVSSMVDLVKAFASSRYGDLPISVSRMTDEGPMPSGGVIIGTKEDFVFAALRKAQAVLDRIGAAGAPVKEVNELRDWLNNERPKLDEMKQRLDAVLDKYKIGEKFEPFPKGPYTGDEFDAAMFDGQEGVLTPGGQHDELPAQARRIEQAMYRVLAAEKLHGLTAKDFGRPEFTRGMWRAELSETAIEKLNRVPGEPVTPQQAESYKNAALAHWGKRRNTDWIKSFDPDNSSDPGRTGLLASDTNDKLMVDRTKGSANVRENRLQGVGQYLDVLAGVPVRANHPEGTLYMSFDQLVGSSYLHSPSGVSGTLKQVENALYDRHGIGPVPEIPNFYRDKIEDVPDAEFKTREGKLEAMGLSIFDDLVRPDGKIELIVKDGTVVGAKQRGRPHWVVMTDNRDIAGDDVRIVRGDDGRVVEEIPLNSWKDKNPEEYGVADWINRITEEEIHAEAAAAGLPVAEKIKLDYTMRDARWYELHGNGVKAEVLANEQTKQWGAPGSLHIGHKADGRGASPKPTPESVEIGGTAVKSSGGPAYGERNHIQIRGRAQRGGVGEDHENGGFPGTFQRFLSEEDYYGAVADHGVREQVVRFHRAVEEHEQAIADHRADDTPETRARLDETDQAVRQAVQTLREQTAPAVERAAEQQLLSSGRHGGYRANAPPVLDTGHVPPGMDFTTPPPEVETPEVEAVTLPQDPGDVRQDAETHDDPDRQDDSPPKTTPNPPAQPPRFDGSADTLSPKRSDTSGRGAPEFAPPVSETNSGPGLGKIFDAADSYSAAGPDGLAIGHPGDRALAGTFDAEPRLGLGSGEYRADPNALLETLVSEKLSEVGPQDRVDVFDWSTFRDKFATVDFPVGTQFEFIDGTGGGGYVASVEHSAEGTQVRLLGAGDAANAGRQVVVGADVFRDGLRTGWPQLSGGSVVRVVQPGPAPGAYQVWETARFLHALDEGDFGEGTRVSWREPSEHGEQVASAISRPDGGFDVYPNHSTVSVVDLRERLRGVGAVEVVPTDSASARKDPSTGDTSYTFFGRVPTTGTPVAFASSDIDLLSRIARLGPALTPKEYADIARELRAAGDRHADEKTVKQRIQALAERFESFDLGPAAMARAARAWGLRARVPEVGDVDHEQFGRNPATGEQVLFLPGQVDLLQRYAQRKPTLESKKHTDVAAELKGLGDLRVTENSVRGRLQYVYQKLVLVGDDRTVLGAVRAARAWGVLAPFPMPGDLDFEYHGFDPVSNTRVSFTDEHMSVLIRLVRPRPLDARAIARELGISTPTAKKRISTVFATLNVAESAGVAELGRVAREWGLLFDTSGPTTQIADGSAAHQQQAGPAGPTRFGLTHPTAVAVRSNDCVRLAFTELLSDGDTTDTPATIPTTAAGLAGRTRTELEKHAAAALHDYRDHDHIRDQLLRLGHGHKALVVDNYQGKPDRNGIGGHVYVMRNVHGTIRIADRARRRFHPYPPVLPRELSRTRAIFYTPDNQPIQPTNLPATHTPTRPEANLGLSTGPDTIDYETAQPVLPRGRPSVPPIAQRSDSVLARAAAQFDNLFDQPRSLNELYTALQPIWPDLSFADLEGLRAPTYLRNGIQLPTVSWENMDRFLRLLWPDRERAADADVIYNAYSILGAGEPPADVHAFKDDMVQILARRPPGPAQVGTMEELGVLTPGNADDVASEDIQVVHFTRQPAAAAGITDGAKFKIYVNATGNARSTVTAHLVHEVLDNPARFPGVHEVKAFGPEEHRVDGVVVYTFGTAATNRVIEWLREFQNANSHMFYWDAPVGTQQVLAGVGFGAEGRQHTFGDTRAIAIFTALDMHRRGTFDDFRNEVRNQFRDHGVDPDQPHLNLPEPHRTLEEVTTEVSTGRSAVPPATQRQGSVLDHAAAQIEDIFRQPYTLDELYTALQPAWPDLSFDDLRELRTSTYRSNGVELPTVSLESLTAFLQLIWDDRLYAESENHIYEAYLTRGAGDPPADAGAFKDDMVRILSRRPPGPAREGDMEERGTLTPYNAENVAPEDIPVVHFTRTSASGEIPTGHDDYKLYVNATGNARSRVTAHLVHEVLDNPARFPGIHQLKVFGPQELRVDGIVIYAQDRAAAGRVRDWLREFQNRHIGMFHWDAPTGTEQVLAGVGFAAEPRSDSFGRTRAGAIYTALEMHRHATFDDFQREVRNQYFRRGLDPYRVHLNLPASQPGQHLRGSANGSRLAPSESPAPEGYQRLGAGATEAVPEAETGAAEPLPGPAHPDDNGKVDSGEQPKLFSVPPPDLGVQRVGVIGDTANTVLITRNGRDAVVVGPGDSIELDRISRDNAQIRVSSDPQVTYRVHPELLGRDFWDWTEDPAGTWVGTPRRVDSQQRTQLLFYHENAVVEMGAGELLGIQPTADGAVSVKNLSWRVTLASSAVHALGLGAPAASMVPHTGPVFATRNSQPVPSDARAGARADYAVLMNNLGREAERDPQALLKMFHEYPDQTVAVRFFIDGQPEWVRVDRTLPHETSQSSGEPMYAGHTDGEPMWAALAQKAFALLRPDINGTATVSIRPFGAPAHPSPIAPMPGSSITAPAGRLSIVDQDGELLSVRPGDELHGTVDPASPDLLTVWIGDEPTAARHSVHRNLLGELTVFPPASDGIYHWTTPTTPAVEVTGLRWLSPSNAARHAPVGGLVSLRVGSWGDLLLDGNTRVSPPALQQLGRSIARASGPVFGSAGPVPADATQGQAGDCYLLAPLMDIAENNPQAIRDMIVEYPDGTVAVRFFTALGVPQWVRVTRDFYTDANGRMIYAANDARNPLWPALIEKAYAIWRGGDYAMIKGGFAAHVMGQLLPPYELNATGTAHQPVRGLDLATFLHPMRFGVDTIYDLIMEQLGANAVAETAFSFAQRLGQLEPIWDRFDVSRKLDIEHFRDFLGYHLQLEEQAQWQPEITAVLDYLRQINDPAQAMTSSAVQQHFSDLVRFLRGRGDQVLLNTLGFGAGAENITKYPGLVGTHTYDVVDVRSSATGRIEIVLRNPWADNPAVPQTIDGLTYGPDRTVILDATHLTKFSRLSSRGTGTRFAFGNTTELPPSNAPAPETSPPAAPTTPDQPAAQLADSPPGHQATSSADETAPVPRPGDEQPESAAPPVAALAPPEADANTESAPATQSSTSTALIQTTSASTGQVNHIVRDLGSQRDGLKEIVEIVPVPDTTAQWLREQLYRQVVGINGEDKKFRAELGRVLTPRLISSEWSRLLTKSGLPLRVTYRGRLFPVSIRLRLRNARPAAEQLPPVGDRDAPGNGPPVVLWHYARGWSSISNSASEHDLRSLSGSYGAKWPMHERGLRSLDVTPQASVILNQYATRIEAGATVESTVKKLSKGPTIPHTYEQEWQFSLNQGIDDILPTDSTAKVWHDIAGAAPDLLLIWIPKFLVDNTELPRVDPNNLETAPAVFHPEQTQETAPSLSKFPFYSAHSMPNHDELLIDVFRGFRERLVGISDNSLGDLMDFFKEENILGNIPLMLDGWLPSPPGWTRRTNRLASS